MNHSLLRQELEMKIVRLYICTDSRVYIVNRLLCSQFMINEKKSKEKKKKTVIHLQGVNQSNRNRAVM